MTLVDLYVRERYQTASGAPCGSCAASDECHLTSLNFYPRGYCRGRGAGGASVYGEVDEGGTLCRTDFPDDTCGDFEPGSEAEAPDECGQLWTLGACEEDGSQGAALRASKLASWCVASDVPVDEYEVPLIEVREFASADECEVGTVHQNRWRPSDSGLCLPGSYESEDGLFTHSGHMGVCNEGGELSALRYGDDQCTGPSIEPLRADGASRVCPGSDGEEVESYVVSDCGSPQIYCKRIDVTDLFGDGGDGATTTTAATETALASDVSSGVTLETTDATIATEAGDLATTAPATTLVTDATIAATVDSDSTSATPTTETLEDATTPAERTFVDLYVREQYQTASGTPCGSCAVSEECHLTSLSFFPRGYCFARGKKGVAEWAEAGAEGMLCRLDSGGTCEDFQPASEAEVPRECGQGFALGVCEEDSDGILGNNLRAMKLAAWCVASDVPVDEYEVPLIEVREYRNAEECEKGEVYRNRWRLSDPELCLPKSVEGKDGFLVHSGRVGVCSEGGELSALRYGNNECAGESIAPNDANGSSQACPAGVDEEDAVYIVNECGSPQIFCKKIDAKGLFWGGASTGGDDAGAATMATTTSTIAASPTSVGGGEEDGAAKTSSATTIATVATTVAGATPTTYIFPSLARAMAFLATLSGITAACLVMLIW
ncbi:hypothetical protein ACHAWF_019032 [Thalassiosira exigua]